MVPARPESVGGFWQSGLNQKRTVLIDFVATLASLLTRHGNRVGAMMYGSRIQHTVPARGGRNQVLRLINDLLKQPRLSKRRSTDLAPLFNGGLNAIKKRSLVFVISDFISVPGWEKSLNLLGQRHEVIAIRLMGSARNGAAGYGRDHHGGCGDGRAVVRGYAR